MTETFTIEAGLMPFEALNAAIRESGAREVVIRRCLGQRYIGAGARGMRITIEGTPGNALGAYLDGSAIEVHGNSQDATGDTMNDGEICIHGSTGDCAGYAMRGGAIYVQGSAGYRAGVHMKAYEDKAPVLVIGGGAGSFLGEYQAGGSIIVLGQNVPKDRIVGRFCGTGMHGGAIYLRTDEPPFDRPPQVMAAPATPEDLEAIRPWVENWCARFGGDAQALLAGPFIVLRPNSSSPYKQLYVMNRPH